MQIPLESVFIWTESEERTIRDDMANFQDSYLEQLITAQLSRK